MVAEVVTTADLTNVLIKAAQVPEKPAETPKAPKSIKEEVIEEKKSEEHKAEIIEKDQQVVAENIAPKKKEEKPKPKPEKKKAEKKAKKAETKKQPKKKDDPFEVSVLKSLEESNKKKEEKPDKKDTKTDLNFVIEMEKALVGKTNTDFDSNQPITMSERDAIGQQIKDHWNMISFSGAENVKDLTVKFRIELDIDGNVIYAKPFLESNKSAYYKPFVESAERAILLATPLQHLPSKEKFKDWKEIELTFDPSGMIY